MPWQNITQGTHRIRFHRESGSPSRMLQDARFNSAISLSNSDDPLSHLFDFENRWGVDKMRDAARSYRRSAWLRIRIHLRLRISIPNAAGCATAPFNLETSLTHSDEPFSHLSYIERTDRVLTHV